MHGKALLGCLCILWVWFCFIFYWDISFFPVSVSSLQQIPNLMAVYVSLWFAPCLLCGLFLCCWEKRKMAPLNFSRSKQFYLSRYTSDQCRALRAGRNFVSLVRWLGHKGKTKAERCNIMQRRAERLLSKTFLSGKCGRKQLLICPTFSS